MPSDSESTPLVINSPDNNEPTLADLKKQLDALLTAIESEANPEVGAQATKVMVSVLVNALVYLTVASSTSYLGACTGVIASMACAATLFFTDKLMGYSKTFGLGENYDDSIKFLHTVALSEGIRGVGGLAGKINADLGMALAAILPGLPTGVWSNEAGKSRLALE